VITNLGASLVRIEPPVGSDPPDMCFGWSRWIVPSRTVPLGRLRADACSRDGGACFCASYHLYRNVPVPACVSACNFDPL